MSVICKIWVAGPLRARIVLKKMNNPETKPDDGATVGSPSTWRTFQEARRVRERSFPDSPNTTLADGTVATATNSLTSDLV